MPSLTTIWAEGWAATRNRPSPAVTPYGSYIDVGLPRQRGRHVVDEQATARVAELAARIGEPWIFIKAFGAPDAIGAMMPAGWSIDPAVWLMTAPLARQRWRDPVLAGYRAVVTNDRALTIELRDPHGDVGATGRAAVVGRWCVFDQIVTAEDHRRRGLGSAVMRLLSREAMRRGAATGLLVATDDGRSLYDRLGWALEGPVVSAVRQVP